MTADVAVYAPLAGTVYLPGAPVGGAELQSAQLVRSLVNAGLRVRHVVSSDAHLPDRVGEVEIVKLGPGYPSGGLPRRRAILAALRAADARVYVQRSAGFETAMVGVFARLARRRFVFSSSSTADFALDRLTATRAGAGLDHRPTRLQYRLGLRLADAVVVQTEEQRDLAASNLGLTTHVIRSFAEPVSTMPHTAEAFVWIGGIVDFKNPHAYLELARLVPEAQFWMVATSRGSAWEGLARSVREAAADIPNITLLEPLARARLLDLYSRAVALVNTSHFEGLPNTFLEAWARGVPALSLSVDPDRRIELCGLGVAAGGSLARLAAAARELWAQRHTTETRAAALRAYVARVHAPAVVGSQWVDLVNEFLER